MNDIGDCDITHVVVGRSRSYSTKREVNLCALALIVTFLRSSANNHGVSFNPTLNRDIPQPLSKWDLLILNLLYHIMY